MAGRSLAIEHRFMAMASPRRSSDDRANAHDILAAFLARPISGVFLVVSLLGTFLGLGSPQLLLTLSGLAALWLAIDLLLAWSRRPVQRTAGGYLNLLAWTAGLGVLAAAVWKSSDFAYHAELVALVGSVVAVGVGLGSPHAVTVVWALAAGTAIAFGASMVAPLTAESAIAPAAVAVGAWFGAAIGVVVDRMVPASRVSGRQAAASVSGEATVGTSPSGVPARVRETPRAS